MYLTDMHLIQFPIGDFNQEGHGVFHNYMMLSNKTVEEIREIHFKSKKLFGFTPEDICNHYNEYKWYCERHLDRLKEYDFDVYRDLEIPKGSTIVEVDGDDIIYIKMDSTCMVLLWKKLLELTDNTLQLTLLTGKRITFFGFDEKGRHINQVGYGLFE